MGHGCRFQAQGRGRRRRLRRAERGAPARDIAPELKSIGGALRIHGRLIGFQNRLLVLLRWTFSFVTKGRGARLIGLGAKTPEP